MVVFAPHFDCPRPVSEWPSNGPNRPPSRTQPWLEDVFWLDHRRSTFSPLASAPILNARVRARPVGSYLQREGILLSDPRSSRTGGSPPLGADHLRAPSVPSPSRVSPTGEFEIVPHDPGVVALIHFESVQFERHSEDRGANVRLPFDRSPSRPVGNGRVRERWRLYPLLPFRRLPTPRGGFAMRSSRLVRYRIIP